MDAARTTRPATVHDRTNYIQQSTRFHLAGNKVAGWCSSTTTSPFDAPHQRYVANYSAQCCGFAVEFPGLQLSRRLRRPQDSAVQLFVHPCRHRQLRIFFGNFGGATY
jgi:hypothetical protein